MRWRSQRVPVLLWEETDLESKSFPRKMKKNGRAPPHIPVSRSPFPHRGRRCSGRSALLPSAFPLLAALPAVPIAIPMSRRVLPSSCPAPAPTRTYGNWKALGFRPKNCFQFRTVLMEENLKPALVVSASNALLCFLHVELCGICMGVGKRNRLQTANRAAPSPVLRIPR